MRSTIMLLVVAVVAMIGAASAWSTTGTQLYCYMDGTTVKTPDQAAFASSTEQILKIGTGNHLAADSMIQNYQNQYYSPVGMPATVATATKQDGTSTISAATSQKVTECDSDLYVDVFKYNSEQSSAIGFQVTDGAIKSAVSNLNGAGSTGIGYLPGATVVEQDGFVGSGSGAGQTSWVKAGVNMMPSSPGVYDIPSAELKYGTLGYKGDSDACVYLEGCQTDLALISTSAWVGGEATAKAMHLNDANPQVSDFAGAFISGDFQWDSRLDVNCNTPSCPV